MNNFSVDGVVFYGELANAAYPPENNEPAQSSAIEVWSEEEFRDTLFAFSFKKPAMASLMECLFGKYSYHLKRNITTLEDAYYHYRKENGMRGTGMRAENLKKQKVTKYTIDEQIEHQLNMMGQEQKDHAQRMDGYQKRLTHLQLQKEAENELLDEEVERRKKNVY